MSLDNIQLPSIVIHDLFRNCLVELNSDEGIESKNNTNALSYLGANKENILILINNPDAIYLSDKHLNFLIGILAACKFTLADVAIINLSKTPAINYTRINEELSPRVTLLFGVSPLQIELPFDVPLFQVQQFNQRSYLVAPALNEVEADKELKRHLWVKLQQIFDI